MTFKDKIKLMTAILLFSFATKSIAQNNESVGGEFKGLSVRPISAGTERSASGEYSYLFQSVGADFGLNKNYAIDPFLSVVGLASEGRTSGNRKTQYSQRLTVFGGAGKTIKTAAGPFYLYADGGIGAQNGDPFYDADLGAIYKIGGWGEHMDINAFIDFYYEKFSKNKSGAFGTMFGITFVLKDLLQNKK